MSRFSVLCRFVFASTALALMALSPAGAQTESVLYNFNYASSGGGDNPWGDLIMDSAGNLYGMAANAGAHGGGTVFELTPSGGSWTMQVLHAFGASSLDGSDPLAGLVMDASGNLYGSTNLGGGSDNSGTVFQLTPHGDGKWSETILHSFVNNGIDGIYPGSNLILDSAGNLFGTTAQGGTHNAGTVFELSPHSGPWTEKILYSLPNPESSFNSVSAPVTFDSAGNLYGTTIIGGTFNWGFVFELTPSASGPWTAKVLYVFSNAGVNPFIVRGGLVFDPAGNLYGASAGGGSGGQGTVYELSPSSHGPWIEKTLLSFPASCNPGCEPPAGVIFDSAGNLYGTSGGDFYNGGTVFELSPAGDGTWSQTVLFNFSGITGDAPRGNLLIDSSGNLYGTTKDGGTWGLGTAFEVAP